MQNGLSEKNRTALEIHGAKQILTDLVNVPATGEQEVSARAMAFLDKYGALRQKPSPEILTISHIVGKALPNEVDDVIQASQIFRSNWLQLRDNGIEVLERFFEMLFNVPVEGPYDRPVVRLNFAKNRWEPVPRTLIEHLAVEFVKSRKLLHRCEHPECPKFFIKAFSRDRYCSNRCGEDMRSRGQSQWQRNHRQELNARRRVPKKRRRRNVHDARKSKP